MFHRVFRMAGRFYVNFYPLPHHLEKFVLDICGSPAFSRGPAVTRTLPASRAIPITANIPLVLLIPYPCGQIGLIGYNSFAKPIKSGPDAPPQWMWDRHRFSGCPQDSWPAQVDPLGFPHLRYFRCHYRISRDCPGSLPQRPRRPSTTRTLLSSSCFRVKESGTAAPFHATTQKMMRLPCMRPRSIAYLTR